MPQMILDEKLFSPISHLHYWLSLVPLLFILCKILAATILQSLYVCSVGSHYTSHVLYPKVGERPKGLIFRFFRFFARRSRLQIIYVAGLFSLSLWYDVWWAQPSSPVLRTWPKLKMQLYFAAVSCSCCSVRQQHCSSCRLALARCSAAAVSLSSYLLPSTPAIFESPLTNNEIVWNMILLYALYFRLQE